MQQHILAQSILIFVWGVVVFFFVFALIRLACWILWRRRNLAILRFVARERSVALSARDDEIRRAYFSRPWV